MTTAGIAAASPSAVASSASAMPGATTARLVVCDFEMPMKLFLIAPDGAEQADEGRGRADGGEHAGPTHDPTPAACFDAVEPRRDPFLDAFSVGKPGGASARSRPRREIAR